MVKRQCLTGVRKHRSGFRNSASSVTPAHRCVSKIVRIAMDPSFVANNRENVTTGLVSHSSKGRQRGENCWYVIVTLMTACFLGCRILKNCCKCNINIHQSLSRMPFSQEFILHRALCWLIASLEINRPLQRQKKACPRLTAERQGQWKSNWFNYPWHIRLNTQKNIFPII